MIDLPTLGLVLITSVVNALNPCTIGVLLLIISIILGQGASSSRLFKSGSTYLLALLITYVAVGLSFVFLYDSLPDSSANYVSVAIALLAIIAGLIHIKDYFWYGKGISLQIPDRFANKIHKKSIKSKNMWSLFVFGIFVAIALLSCNGASYFVVLTILDAEVTLATTLLILLYNLLFLIPMYCVLMKVVRGTKTTKLTKWKEKNKALMRLATGVMLVGLGWILLLATNGTVSFG